MKGAAAIILAAGASSRLGEPKQLLQLGTERLLERAVRIAAESGCETILVVLGFEAGQIRAECDLGAASVVLNSRWREGMAASIRAGVAALGAGCARAILTTCDQPAVTSAHLGALLERCGEEPIASCYAGRHGVPAGFPRDHFAELMGLTGDTGARRLLQQAPSIELEGGELDVDTPEAWLAARAIYDPD